MTRRQLKKPVLYGIYAVGVIALIGTFYLAYNSVSKTGLKEDDSKYVTDTIFDDTKPVNTEVKVLKRPYNDTEIKIVKNYYDYKADENTQKNAIIVHENTYLQNSGVSYGGKDNFEVVAVMDGTVADVKKDDLLGNVVQIQHDNNVISIYQSLGEVSVAKGATVKQGQIIGKSGTNNVESDLGSHLHFELILSGATVNAEEYYDKTLPTVKENSSGDASKNTNTDTGKESNTNKNEVNQAE